MLIVIWVAHQNIELELLLPQGHIERSYKVLRNSDLINYCKSILLEIFGSAYTFVLPVMNFVPILEPMRQRENSIYWQLEIKLQLYSHDFILRMKVNTAQTLILPFINTRKTDLSFAMFQFEHQLYHDSVKLAFSHSERWINELNLIWRRNTNFI